MEADVATRVLAIRHGETEWNVQARLQGQRDVPLNRRGEDQARRLALALNGEPLAAIYASDLARAASTAEAIGRLLGLPVHHDIGLRERAFGIFEGHTHQEVSERWPAENERWKRRDVGFGPEGGEVLGEFHARCVATAAQIAAAHPGQTIALIAHGGVLDCLYRAASRIALDAPRTWRIGNTSINRLLYTPGGFSLVGWSDEMHLADGAFDEPADA